MVYCFAICEERDNTKAVRTDPNDQIQMEWLENIRVNSFITLCEVFNCRLKPWKICNRKYVIFDRFFYEEQKEETKSNIIIIISFI